MFLCDKRSENIHALIFQTRSHIRSIFFAQIPIFMILSRTRQSRHVSTQTTSSEQRQEMISITAACEARALYNKHLHVLRNARQEFKNAHKKVLHALHCPVPEVLFIQCSPQWIFATFVSRRNIKRLLHESQN